MIKLVGVLCLFTALMLLAFSGLMYALETPLQTCLVMGIGSLFPFALAVACFSTKYRTAAIRIVGGIIGVAGLASLVASFVVANDEFNPSWKQKGIMFAITMAGAIMAVRGKWPGEEKREEEPKEHDTGGSVVG